MKRRKTALYEVGNPPVPKLSELACEACGVLGVTVILVGCHQGVLIDRCWCGVQCARAAGWPWLVSEPQRVKRSAAR